MMLHKTIFAGLLAVIITVVLSAGAYAQLCPTKSVGGSSYSPWPKFNFDNENTSKTFNFGTQVGRLKWEFSTGGPVTASPVLHCTVDDVCYSDCVADGGVFSEGACARRCQDCTVYVGSADNNMYAINAQTGQIRWLYRTGAAIEYASAAIDVNNVMYFGSNDGYFYAFDLDTLNPLNPQPLWVFNTRTESLGKGASTDTVPRAAINSSPAIDIDGTIIFASMNGNLYALNPDGSIKWRRFITPSWSSPAINIDDGIVYIGSWEGRANVTQYTLSAACDPEEPGEREQYTVSAGYGYESFWILDAADGSDVNIWPGWPERGFPVGTPPESFFPLLSNDELCEWIDTQPADALQYTRRAISGFTCIPGGIIASPAIMPSYNVLLAWLTTFTDWPDWCDTDASNNNLWLLSRFGGGVWTMTDGEPMYSTPAVIEDGSFFAVTGQNVYRGLPDGLNYYSVATIGERSESSPSVDGILNIYLGSNGGYFYCINANSPEDPILWQYPREGDPPLIQPNGQIASIISSPAIGDDIRRSVYVGASNGRVYAFFDGGRIFGRVMLETVVNGQTVREPLSGVKITLTAILDDEDGDDGEETVVERVTYTDLNGDYEFQAVADGTYTITPDRAGSLFRPQSRTVIFADDRDIEANFLATGGFAISGSVLESCETPMAGVNVVLTGERSGTASTRTAADGTFVFAGLGYDTYTIGPSSAGFSFQPLVRTVAIDESTAADITGIDFCAWSGLQVSGTVRSAFDGSPIEGVTVRLLGTVGEITVLRNTTTDQAGNYSFARLESATYTITPVAPNYYTFEPESREVELSGFSDAGIDFVAVSGLVISGRVVFPGVGEDELQNFFSRVTINLYRFRPGSTVPLWPHMTAQPDENGEFVFYDTGRGRFTVVPQLDGWGFEPSAITVNVPSARSTGLVFEGYEGLFIAGRVRGTFGTGLPGVEIDLVRLSDDVVVRIRTGADGRFVFTGLEPDFYSVGPDPVFFRSMPKNYTVDLYRNSRSNLRFFTATNCNMVHATFPPVGAEGTLVNIYGVNFGTDTPKEDEVVAVTGPKGSSATLPAGVYFGGEDPNTWVPAKRIISWSSVKVVVDAPGGFGIQNVFVIRTAQSPDDVIGDVAPDSFGCYGSGRAGVFISLY